MSHSILMTLDGERHDPDAPFLCADDLAAVRGDGIFETLLVRGGRARCVALHLERLARSAAMLDLPEPDADAWREVIDVAGKQWTADAPRVATMSTCQTRFSIAATNTTGGARTLRL